VKSLNCNKLAIALFFSASLVLTNSSVLAGSGEEQIPVGPRPLALGGAYTAIATGPDAVFWNPAGLALLRTSAVRGATANLFGLGIRDNTFTLVSPIGERLGLGLEWYHSGFSSDDVEDGLNRITFGAGYRPWTRVRLGANVKYRQYSQTYEGQDQGRGSGLGADLSAWGQVHRSVSRGLMWRDVGGSTLTYDDGTNTRPFDSYVQAGAALKPWKWLLVAADVSFSRDAHAGVEWQPHHVLSLRGGWTKDLQGLDGSRWSAGLGLRWGPLVAEYTFQDHPALDPTHRFGLSVDFTLAPKLVEVNEVHLEPLFASFYKSYATDEAGEIVLTNISDNPVEIELKVDQSSLMAAPTTERYHLKPGVAQRIPVRMRLSPDVVKIRESQPVAFDVEVSYVSGGRPRHEDQQVQTFVYGAGSINWGDGVERAAAFITPTHDMVENFTRGILRATTSTDESVLNGTTTNGAKLFDGMSALGLTYTPDALNPYGAVQGQAFAVDDIQYPAELLVSRSGDCDDTTVLYASMLESVGIRCALIDVPEHIYVMFDTGIHARERSVTGLDPELFIEREGTLWVPVETTALGEPFNSAWRKGANLYRRWENTDRLQVVDVLQARQRYEAAVYAARVPKDAQAPQIDNESVKGYVNADLATIGQWRSDYLQQTYLAQLDSDSSAETLLLSRVYYLNQDYTRARAELQRVPEAVRTPSVWNNLGATQLALNEVDPALQSLQAARRADPSDPGIALNLGLALSLQGRDAEAQRQLAAAVHGSGGVNPAMDLLGIKQQPTGARAGESRSLEQLTLQEIEAMLEAALNAVPEAVTTESDAPADSSGIDVDGVDPLDDVTAGAEPESTAITGTDSQDVAGSPSADEPRTVPAAARGEKVQPEVLAEMLYWKHD